jgi:pimeloyl-ACP methyl ester carboxylesterase
MAIVNPLRGLKADAAYAASAINQLPGPVLAVGHSYGGAVITNAAPKADNIVGLVYVAAFAPEEGESCGSVTDRSNDSILGQVVLEKQFPIGEGPQTSVELIIDPARFRESFAGDLPQLDSDVLAWSQRPLVASALGDETGHPAWKDLPSWAAVGTEDKAAGADVVKSMAERAGARITEIPGSHVIMISQPDAVTDVILGALKSVS